MNKQPIPSVTAADVAQCGFERSSSAHPPVSLLSHEVRMEYKFEAFLYFNSRPAIQVYDEDCCPYCTLSVNIVEADLADDEICVQAWNLPTEFTQMLLASGKFADTGRVVEVGYTSAPVWRIRCAELLGAISRQKETSG